MGIERLTGKTSRHRAADLHRWLAKVLQGPEPPDVICVENFLPPTASFSGDATVGQLLLHGALHGIAGDMGFDVTSVSIAEARKHFCGQATATRAQRGVPRSSAQKNAARIETKKMVIARARQLGYIKGKDMLGGFEDLSTLADAACVFDWAVAHIARAGGAHFQLFSAESA